MSVCRAMVGALLVVAACANPTATTTTEPLQADTTARMVTTTTVPPSTTTVPPTTTIAPSTTIAPPTTNEVGVDWEAIRSAEWLIYGPDGILTSDWVQVWEPNVAVGDNAIIRDGSGGYVWNDLDGLWWLPANASAPTLVLEGDISLLGVTPTYTGPVAQLGPLPPRHVDLRTGTYADPPENPRVRYEGEPGPSRTVVWTAGNGLEARVTPPKVVYDNEGQPADVTQPARLIVTKGDTTIVDFPVGSFYSPSVRLHDFDGQRLILSRGPFEPALPEETFFVVDLACGECLATFSAGATHAALVGPDSTYADVHSDGLPGRLVAAWLGTDEGVSKLADGVYLGFLQPEGTSESQVSFDLAVWFDGPDANRAAAEDGESEIPVPGDFYIRNRNPKVFTVPVDSQPAVTSVWFNYPDDQDLEPDPISYTDLLAALAAPEDDRIAVLRADPWWITIEDGKVVGLDEQYVP